MQYLSFGFVFIHTFPSSGSFPRKINKTKGEPLACCALKWSICKVSWPPPHHLGTVTPQGAEYRFSPSLSDIIVPYPDSTEKKNHARYFTSIYLLSTVEYSLPFLGDWAIPGRSNMASAQYITKHDIYQRGSPTCPFYVRDLLWGNTSSSARGSPEHVLDTGNWYVVSRIARS